MHGESASTGGGVTEILYADARASRLASSSEGTHHSSRDTRSPRVTRDADVDTVPRASLDDLVVPLPTPEARTTLRGVRMSLPQRAAACGCERDEGRAGRLRVPCRNRLVSPRSCDLGRRWKKPSSGRRPAIGCDPCICGLLQPRAVVDCLLTGFPESPTQKRRNAPAGPGWAESRTGCHCKKSLPRRSAYA